MINLLLNMQTDHLAITGKSTPLKNTAFENARFPPRAIYIYYYDGDLMDIVYFLIISKKKRKIIFLTASIDYW